MPNTDDSLENFIDLLRDQLSACQWQKLVLSKYRGNEPDLKRLTVRPINLRSETALSFVYTYQTRDITKNLDEEEALKKIHELLGSDFKNAHFFSTTQETQLEISKKGKVLLTTRNTASAPAAANNQHNRDKKRFVDINRPYLCALGVTDQQHQLIPAMSKKWKQINKFIEVFSHALEQSTLDTKRPLQVVDFGSGKGYLTFAIHDYLRNALHNEATVTGVELREALAILCNKAAQTLEHKGLDFVCGDVKSHAPQHTDVMIALHACDTATDYAIHYGIRAGASIIMCSPCCHKQIRPQLKRPDVLKPMLQYGIHCGQEAEMVTDTLRALLLEANGYSSKIFEFVSLEHTNKNKMILAVKNKQAGNTAKVLEDIKTLKAFYGIHEHCLETLLNTAS